jgi:hypothetical protein
MHDERKSLTLHIVIDLTDTLQTHTHFSPKYP